MNKQIKRLIELSNPLKEALMKNFEPSCGLKYAPLGIKYLDICLWNGYQTFAFRYNKEQTVLVELSMYSNKIELHFSVTEKHLEEFIKIVEDAIVTLNNAVELKQLQQLKGGNNE